MDEKLMNAIGLETGAENPMREDYAKERNGLCHPVYDSEDVDDGEEFIGGSVLKTPISCGDYALIYNGYALLGAVSDGQVFVSGEGLKTPGRAELVNELLAFPGHRLDPKTWMYHAGDDSEYVDDGVLVSSEGIVRNIDDEQRKNPVDDKMLRRVRYYTEYIIDMLDVHGGAIEQSVARAEESGYTIDHSRLTYADKEMMAQLSISVDLLHGAADILGIDYSEPITGRLIWSYKQCLQDVLFAVLDMPTNFKKIV